MLELQLDARRGSFHLQIKCAFASQWTVIFGPSGSGKSTLLRLLAGLDHPDRGRIILDGQPLTSTESRTFLKPGRRGIGLVAQQPALFPHMNVMANVSFGLSAISRERRNQRVDEMLELVGAGDLVHRRPAHLSGGEAQ